MKYLYFTSRKELKKIKEDGLPQGQITLIPWSGEAEQRWGRIKAFSRWIRGKCLGVVVELREDQYPVECYVRFSSGEVGLGFYRSLKFDPIDGVTLDEEWYDYAVGTSSGGWRSSLRVTVGSERAMEILVARGGSGSVEVVVG